MTIFLPRHLGLLGGWLLTVGGVGLVVLTALVPVAHAQVPDDTSRVDTVRAERLMPSQPADPDTLPPDALEPPFDPSAQAPPPADTGQPERAVVNADSLSALERNGEPLQELFGNVYVRQDTTHLYSEYALRYLDRDEVLFIDNVVIHERGDTLRADTVRYNRSSKVGRARGNVYLTDGDVEVRAPRATYFGDEKRSVFPDTITLVDSSRVLRAKQGTYWSDDQRAEFGGQVRLSDPDTYLEADSLTYFRDTERSIARGDVFIDRQGEEEAEADTTTRTYLFGDRADNQEQRRYSRVEGQAVLVQVRVDSVGAPEDTLVVRAQRLEAFRTDTHRRLVAVDSVEIWQPDLSAVADSVVYDRVVGATTGPSSGDELPIDTARASPDSLAAITQADPSAEELPAGEDVRIRSDTMRAPPDSVAQGDTTGAPLDSIPADTMATPEGEQEVAHWETPSVQEEGSLPLEETRLFRNPVTWFEQSQVWGDSIRVRARGRSLDSVFVRGSAFATQQAETHDRINQLKGRNITASFRSDSLRRIVARPNAEAIRFLTDEVDSLTGAVWVSGDRIVIRFRDGAAKRVSTHRGVQSNAYHERELIPDPFHLDGFQWTPERRPTRNQLLRDERVRRRLDLGPDRPIAQRGREGAPAAPSTVSPRDSVAPDTSRSLPEGGPSDSPSAEETPSNLLPTFLKTWPLSNPIDEQPVGLPDTTDTSHEPDL